MSAPQPWCVSAQAAGRGLRSPSRLWLVLPGGGGVQGGVSCSLDWMDELMLRPATGMAFFFFLIFLSFWLLYKNVGRRCTFLVGSWEDGWIFFFSLLPPAGLLWRRRGGLLMSKPRPVHPSFDRDPSWSIFGASQKEDHWLPYFSLLWIMILICSAQSGGKVVRLSAGFFAATICVFSSLTGPVKSRSSSTFMFWPQSEAGEHDPSVLQKGPQNADHHTASNIAKDALMDAYSLTFWLADEWREMRILDDAVERPVSRPHESRRRCVIWIDDWTVILIGAVRCSFHGNQIFTFWLEMLGKSNG